MVVGGWIGGVWTDTTETLVEGGSAWTLHSGTLPDGGFGYSGILNYNNVLYLFGGEDADADRKIVQHCRDQRSEIGGHSRSEIEMLLAPAPL